MVKPEVRLSTLGAENRQSEYTGICNFYIPPDSIAANGFYGNSNLTNYTLNEGGGKVVIE